MKNVFSNSKAIALVALFAIIIILAAWKQDNKDKKDTTAKTEQTGDTTVPKQHIHGEDEFELKDLDASMKQLDLVMENLNINMKGLDSQVAKSVRDALAAIDFEKISADALKQVQALDFDKINKQVQAELKNVDMNKISADVNKSLMEAQQEIKNIDISKMQNDMKEMQLKINSGAFKSEIDSAMQNAKKEIYKAKQELQDLKDFTDALQKDGLIDKKKGFTIEWKKDGTLVINGKVQPKEISDKYSRYYKKDGYRIKVNAGDSDDLKIESF